jgi:uncharacterized protein (TIGR02284 family)
MFESNQEQQLEKLLTRLIDSYDGYKACAENAEQHRHTDLFTNFGNTRQKFANEIRDLMTSHGMEVDTDGSFLAKAHRFFTNIKMKLDADDEELLESIAYGEGNLLTEYRDTIEAFKSDEKVLSVIQTQYNEVLSNYDLVVAKEEAA